MEVDNANPTVLNVSELPSRQTKKAAVVKRVAPELEFVLRKPEYLRAPLSDLQWSTDDDESDDNGFTIEPIDEQEIYDLISTISDPEHPLSLGQLAVVNLPDIHITPSPSAAAPPDPNSLTTVLVKITPTISHCSLATVIGLCVRVRLERSLPPNYRVDVKIKEGSHADADQVNKQLADKERVIAAQQNDNLKAMLNKMLQTCV
ncbi:FAM96B protein [Xylaria sp. CBS 124048]|nr:FAM96B protein [Xylaria sp. CBS 124048]